MRLATFFEITAIVFGDGRLQRGSLYRIVSEAPFPFGGAETTASPNRCSRYITLQQVGIWWPA